MIGKIEIIVLFLVIINWVFCLVVGKDKIE